MAAIILNDYNILLLTLFLMLLSLLSYILALILIYHSEGYKRFAVRLFMTSVIAQLFYLIPQIVFPFLSNPFGDPTDEFAILSERQCKLQAYFMNSSWFATAMIANYVNYSIWQTLQGQQTKRSNQGELKVYLCIGFLTLLLNVPFYFLAQMGRYGYSWRGSRYYFGCNISITNSNDALTRTMLFLELGINLVIFLGTLGFSCFIKCYKFRKIIRLGLSLNYPIFQMWIFPVLIIILWNWNLLMKSLDTMELKPNATNLAWNLVWLVLQSVFEISGVFLTSLFLYSYQDLMLPQLGSRMQRLYRLLTKISCFNAAYGRNETPYVESIEETSLYEDSKVGISSLINQSAAD